MRLLMISLSFASDFKAELLGELVVDRDRGRRLQRFGDHLELGLLAGELLRRIGLRECDADGSGLARGNADKLFLEAGDETAGPDLQRDVAPGAAFERSAVDLAGEVDDDAVAVLRLGALALCCERPVLLRQTIYRLVDFGVGDFGDRPLQLDALEVGDLDRRHDLDRHRVGEIGLALDYLFDRLLVGRQRHLRIAHQSKAALGDDLGVGLANHVLDRLRHRRAAVEALEMGDRDLALTETVEANLALQLVQPLVRLRHQIGGGDDHLEFALETFVRRFGYLHHTIFVFGPWDTAPLSGPVSVRVRADGAPRRGAGGGT